MVELRGKLSHKLERARTLAQWRAGKLRSESIQDADALLLAAAQYHGTSAAEKCPICAENTMKDVTWVYGEELGRISGSARSWAEIEVYIKKGHEFTVHIVEVCLTCKWNYLLEETYVVPPRKPQDANRLSYSMEEYTQKDDES